MATWIAHLRITENLLQEIPYLPQAEMDRFVAGTTEKLSQIHGRLFREHAETAERVSALELLGGNR